MPSRWARKMILFFICLLPFLLLAQNKQIDSLLNTLSLVKDDTTRVNTLIFLSKQCLQSLNFADAKKYGEEALALASKNNFKNGIKAAYTNLGVIYTHEGFAYFNKSNHSETLKCFLLSLKMYEKNKDTSGMAKIYRNIGLVYWQELIYSEALKNHLISLKLFEQAKDKPGIAGAYNNIGLVYQSQKNYSEALKYYFSAVKTYEELGRKRDLIDRYFNIGFLYEDQGNYAEALKNHMTALKISEELNDTGAMAASHDNIGDVYYHHGLADSNTAEREDFFREALKDYSVSLKEYEEIKHLEGKAICEVGIGEVLFSMKDYSRAKQYAKEGLSLSKENGAIPSIKDSYASLAKIDSATGNWKAAFSDTKSYILYRDSLFNEENKSKMTRAQMQFDFDKKEDSLKYEQVLANEKIRQQKQTKNYLIAGLVLFACFSFFVYRNYRTHQKLKLQSLRNKIASDLHDDVGSTLSSISIFSQMALEQSGEIKPMLQTIGESSRKMLDAMADIVWNINPENDQFEKIIMRMRNFAYELLGSRKIDFRFVADSNIANTKLSMEARRNLYLIFKEATNNMVKYSQASQAIFNIKQEQGKLVMTIKDNGKGFNTNKETQGNGLKNMQKRASEMGAILKIDSEPGSGVAIKLEMAV
jgi:signal transduction histidine kinase